MPDLYGEWGWLKFIAALSMKLVARKVGGKGLGASFTLNNNRQPGFKKKVKYFFYASAKAIWAVTLAFEKEKIETDNKG